ncbi:hypothetical protein B0T19DRAFT_446231 [Cercophora scortea]|uniref:Uncharacterized protein n=1 Tax=Cercophora scortea TaxID=314031 RepID=A0AAE0I2M9_9PEZI|nr:hypothetical protein B0T19DRAFT_446231 [Cercophora scortea]
MPHAVSPSEASPSRLRHRTLEVLADLRRAVTMVDAAAAAVEAEIPPNINGYGVHGVDDILQELHSLSCEVRELQSSLRATSEQVEQVLVKFEAPGNLEEFETIVASLLGKIDDFVASLAPLLAELNHLEAWLVEGTE